MRGSGRNQVCVSSRGGECGGVRDSKRRSSQRANTVLYSMSLRRKASAAALFSKSGTCPNVEGSCYLFSVSLPDRYLWMTLDSSV